MEAFCVWLLWLNIILWGSSILFGVNHSFLFMYPLILSMSIWVVSSLRLLQTATINIPARVFGVHKHMILLYIYLEVELLYYGICTFGFSECCQIVFPSIILHSHQQYENSVCSTSSPTLGNFISVFWVGV